MKIEKLEQPAKYLYYILRYFTKLRALSLLCCLNVHYHWGASYILCIYDLPDIKLSDSFKSIFYSSANNIKPNITRQL